PALLRSHRAPLSLFSSFFFFYCYGAHRDLHSFPTLRSSDLGCPLSRISSRTSSAQDCFPESSRYGSGLGSRTGGSTLADSSAARDRKSTRLNSSHVKISYAVFCLKKKKTKLSTNSLNERRHS